MRKVVYLMILLGIAQSAFSEDQVPDDKKPQEVKCLRYPNNYKRLECDDEGNYDFVGYRYKTAPAPKPGGDGGAPSAVKVRDGAREKVPAARDEEPTEHGPTGSVRPRQK